MAAIDCGTNSIRLLVADLDPATGALKDLDRRMEIVQLGQGVDQTGRLARGGACERTAVLALAEYADRPRHEAPKRLVRFVAVPSPAATRRTGDFVRDGA